ncbi:hypothetical protein RvY_12601 [Ramazzottius varieornatus]|uniref:Cupin-like domain-containing protein n=1 Tax=Ramazzottius varieornatus TaxID=947166 RepID=A0A1D1VTT1_RAMVA|nr:hypothetical protein RvY_12601 [Ramazzottius varieornatus]
MGSLLFSSIGTMEEQERKVQKLLEKMKQAKLSEKDLDKLPSLRRLLALHSSAQADAYKPSLLLCLAPLVFLAILCYTPAWHVIPWTIVQLGLGRYEAADSTCAVRAHPRWGELFRPPVECSYCADIKAVDSVDRISVEEFTDKYAYTSRPVVVRNAMKGWNASKVFDFEFFRHLYLERFPGSVDVLDEHCQFFGYQTEFRSLKELLTMSAQRFQEMWYVGWSNCDVSVADVLRQHYSRPTFLPLGSQSSRLDWIFMGRPGYGANMHVDNVGRPSWQAQIRGSKMWTIEPPRECYLTCQPLSVTVHPNDIIVLDTDTWFHKTLIVGDEISITIGAEYD